jgi:hypothetical protein
MLLRILINNKINLGRTKTVNIIKNVIAQKEIQDLSNEL